MGLVCVTDIAVAAADASLGLPEVRLGLVPAVISPYVVARVGLAKARHLMLTGVRLNGTQAAEAGLVTTAVQPDKLDDAVLEQANTVLQASPEALAACKKLLFIVNELPRQKRPSPASNFSITCAPAPKGKKGCWLLSRNGRRLG